MIKTAKELQADADELRCNIIEALKELLNQAWHKFIEDMDESSYQELDIYFLPSSSIIVAEHDSDGNLNEIIDSVNHSATMIKTTISTTGDINNLPIENFSNEALIAIVSDFEFQLKNNKEIGVEWEDVEQEN